MEENYRRYPIGIQNFEQLRNRNCVYVDKTELVYRLANTDSVYFLSRPRRFGKSLLVSTLEAYFQGKKELFKGLAMERLEKEWNVYPIFHIDFSLTKYTTLFDLQEQLNLFLLRCEKVYGAEKEEKTPAARLQGMIRRAYEQTGLPVVVLIDEYDAPLLDSNSNIPLQQELRNELRKFFSPLKGLGQYLRFLFITGISKFSQMSIFSELNNLKNISMRDDFSAICGITERELLDELRPDIERMALANGETYEAACAHLKRQYDGYHFSKHCEDIYNPFSLFNAFNAKEYKNFWFSTGTPTFLIDLLQETDFDVRQLEGVEAVYVTVEGHEIPYRQSQLLRGEDVLLSGAEEEPVYIQAELWYPKADGSGLGTESRQVRKTEDATLPQAVLSAWLEGPSSEALEACLPEGAQVHELTVTDGVCTVNLSAGFAANAPADPEAVRRMVYALVNTLGGLEQIDAVRLLAEGEALDALGGVPLEQPIVPDTSLERD